MTEHKELVDDLRAFGKLTTNASAHHGQYLANEAARIIEAQAAEIAALTKERGVAVGALTRVAYDAVSSLDRANARIAALREALTEIGAFDDKLANEYLASHGSYGGFDEPASVMTARDALRHHAAQGD